MKLDRIDRARGCLLGLAVGDAIGTTVEFKKRGTFEPLTDMLGGGPFLLQAGQWTDDTSMALCLAASLLENGFDLNDQIKRYVRWYQEGYMSSNGRCFDIGMTTRRALNQYVNNGNPQAGSMEPSDAGNGCIMRLGPVPIRYSQQPKMALAYCVEQARTTHQAAECLEASKLLGQILICSLNDNPNKKEILLSFKNHCDPSLVSNLQDIARGRYFTIPIHEIKGSGYVVESLEAALWCFYHTNSFEEAVLCAANLGDDADTTAAITGQIAGAFYGEPNIPRRWLEKLVMADEIGEMAECLTKIQH